MNKLVVALFGIASFAGSAVAADLPARVYTKAPPPAPPVMSWTGCYVGGGGGYGMWNQENTPYSVTTGVPLEATQTAGGRGWFGTVQGGCDIQLSSSWLVGLFADYDFTDANGQLGAFGAGIVGNEKMSSKWSAGGRIGYVAFDRLMVFTSAGWTQARYDGVSFAPAVGGGVIDTMPAQTYNGWFIGGGYEYALNFIPGLYWKSEYRFSQYDSKNNTIFTAATGTPFVGLASKKYTQEIRSELVWRFNFGGGPIMARY